MTSGIYLIQCVPTRKVYVGSSVNVENRWKQHLYQLEKGNHHSTKLQIAWSKYGKEAFKFLLIEEVEDSKVLVSVEQKHIDAYNSFAEGYNASQFADRPTSLPSIPTVAITLRLPDNEAAIIEKYCQRTNRTKTDVFREFVRSLANTEQKIVKPNDPEYYYARREQQADFE